jgi:hypothetical protein
MKLIRNVILPVFLASMWISLSEFTRNQYILREFWTTHYHSMGLTFPDKPVNGVFWGIWSLSYAVSVYIIARKFTLIETTLLAWLTGFVLMWIVTGNLGVLPYGILPYAIPLSLVEAFFAALIIKKLTGQYSKSTGSD